LTFCAIVPVKPFKDGKTRLSMALDSEERAELSRVMLLDVLLSLNNSRTVSRCFIVSSDSQVLEISKNPNFAKKTEPIRESYPRGVNEAVSLALLGVEEERKKGEWGLSQVLIVPADVPLTTSSDFEFACQVATAASGDFLVVVPSARLDGTNLLLMTSENPVDLSYDSDSFQSHLRSGENKGLDVRVLFSDALMHDVDTEGDLLEVTAKLKGRKTYTSKFLSNFDGNSSSFGS
jgi:2-phospho-L-lactate guanylyltransferase